MFKNLTYQQKNKGLIVVSILFLVVSYVFSLSKTKDLLVENGELKENVERSLNAPATIKKYQEELREIETIFGNNTDDEYRFQDTLLAFLTPFCDKNGVILRSFPAPHKLSSGGFEVQTTCFSVEASFLKLLHLIYNLEQKQKIGRISGVKFESEENRKTKELRLKASVYIQNFKKTNNENSN